MEQSLSILRSYVFFVSILIIGCFCDGCYDQKLSEKNKKAIAEFNASSVENNIGGQLVNIHESVLNTISHIGLERMDTLFNSFAIRIIHNFDSTGGLQIAFFKYSGSAWSGRYYKAKKSENNSDNSFRIDSCNIEPLCGWTPFINKLFDKGILYLPLMQNIKNFNELVADGSLCYFEIASSKRYRFYYYYSPSIMKDWNYDEAKKVIDLFEIIKNNFDFKEFHLLEK